MKKRISTGVRMAPRRHGDAECNRAAWGTWNLGSVRFGCAGPAPQGEQPAQVAAQAGWRPESLQYLPTAC